MRKLLHGTEVVMVTNEIAAHSVMNGVAQQVKAVTAIQTAVIKMVADNQQRMADMLQVVGLGESVDIQA